ncbi:MAG: DUF2505 family protein [Acidimicrobiales bacterium]
MRFHAEHRFDGSAQAVAALLADPAFYLGLTLPDLSKPELLDQDDTGGASRLRLRYEFIGSLDPIAKRLIGSDRLGWVQEVSIDRAADSGVLRFAAERDARRLHGSADFVLTEVGGDTIRHLDGELVVAVPGIGRMAERRIVPGIRRRMDIEAQILNDRLRPGG